MSHNLINLLPEDRIKAWRREYFVRLATSAVILLAAVTVIHGVLLFPSYLSLSGMKSAKAAELERLNSDLSGSKESEISARLASLRNDAAYLLQLSSTPSASGLMRAVLAVPRPGIALLSFTITPPTDTAATGRMVVVGIASTREALRSYNLALSQLPFVSSADLPISAYAEETNIRFTMTLTGTLMP